MNNEKVKSKKYRIAIFLISSGFLFCCLASGANALATSAATQERPSVSVKINGGKPYPGDALSPTPSIVVTATSTNTVTAIRLRLGSQTAALTFSGAAGTFTATHEVAAALPDGTYSLTIEATDNYGNITTFEITPLYVQLGGVVTVQGLPLNYPNPFDPGTQTTNIGYNLSEPADLTLNIFDLAGNLVKRTTYPAGQSGGNAGYNEVSWNGRSTAGDYVGNGVYIYLLIADGVLAQNGKGKITVFKR